MKKLIIKFQTSNNFIPMTARITKPEDNTNFNDYITGRFFSGLFIAFIIGFQHENNTKTKTT